MLTGRREIDESEAEWIIGSDEAGYGTWAGHLVVAGVVVPRGWSDPKITDSKAYGKNDKARAMIVREQREKVLWKTVTVSSESVDDTGVWPALIRSHNEVHRILEVRLKEKHPGATFLHIVDGLENAKKKLISGLIPLKKADVYVPAVSLASCFAKTGQCALMDLAHTKYPVYGFDSHRGYHSPQHVAALEEHGACPIHRKSFSSIRKYLPQENLLSWEAFGSDSGSES